MIERQFRARALPPAVLTSELVSQKDIRARKADDVLLTAERYELEQPQDRGQPDLHRDRANLTIVFLDHLDLALKKELNGLLPVYDEKWLERRVQNQHVVHAFIIVTKKNLSNRGRAGVISLARPADRV